MKNSWRKKSSNPKNFSMESNFDIFNHIWEFVQKKNKKWYFINQVRVSSKAALKHTLESRLSVSRRRRPAGKMHAFHRYVY